MTVRLIWSAMPRVQAGLEMVEGVGLWVEVGASGFRAVSPAERTPEQLVRRLVRGGVRPGWHPSFSGPPGQHPVGDAVRGGRRAGRKGVV